MDGEFVCILDSDTELMSGSILQILSRLAESREIGIIAPRLVLPNGEVQNSVKKFPTVWHKLAKIPMAVFKVPVKNYDFYETFPFESEAYVDTAISACWFFRTDLLTDIGLLDERIFYAPEDVDFCARVWKNGKKVLYKPDLTVLHNTQQICHQNPFSKVAFSHFFGLLYYYRKHGGCFLPMKRSGVNPVISNQWSSMKASSGCLPAATQNKTGINSRAKSDAPSRNVSTHNIM